MKKRFVLPKKHTLPGGFTIRIEEGAMTCDEDAEFSYSAEGHGVLRLRKGLTKKQQRYHFSHEMIHAMIDYHHLMIREGAGP